MATPSSEILCPDWMFSNTSNVHACKNRGWFKDYTPFDSFAGSSYTGDHKITVLGVGTVVIPTKKKLESRGRNNHGEIVLTDVIHTPDLPCNIMAGICEDYDVELRCSEKKSGTIKDIGGRSVAYFDASKRLFVIKISGPPVGPVVGPSVFDDQEKIWLLNIVWGEMERERWDRYKQDNQRRVSDISGHDTPQSKKTPNRHPQPGLGYTKEEKAWLEKNYANEWEFLRANNLSIFNEEDREKGRNMVRAFIAEETPTRQ